MLTSNPMEPIYVIGCGAVGVPLMACLAAAGRRVVGVRASEEDAPEQTVTVPVTVDDQALDLPLQTVGIGRLGEIKGPVVIATKRMPTWPWPGGWLRG